MTATWHAKEIRLTGSAGANFNHAKIGVSLADGKDFSIFGDVNQ
jgi:hypothetical protein